MLNYLTPHGKWHIHSTYGDNQRMMTLSRGIEPLWMNDKDAAELGIEDNDWVEVYNDNGVVVHAGRRQRAHPARHLHPVPLARAHAIGVPKSPLRGNRRAGGHNSLTRIRLKPNLMVGGYGQFTYHFNYWGPTGCNRDTLRPRAASCRSRATGRREEEPDERPLLKSRWCSTSTSASAATPAASPARTCGPTARAPSTCGGTTSRPSPAPAIPTQWEDQEQYKRRLGTSRTASCSCSSTGKARTRRQHLPQPAPAELDDYYEPWTYDYQDLFNAPRGRRPADRAARSRWSPASRSTSRPARTGTTTSAARRSTPRTIRTSTALTPRAARSSCSSIERLVFFYLPRICNHCLNPACVAACPSGALYKRGEDGIVLVDQERCRGWRTCVAAARTRRSSTTGRPASREKCILCFPRLETGQAPACFHSCVGRIRYLGVLLYDADRSTSVAACRTSELVDAQRDDDPRSARSRR